MANFVWLVKMVLHALIERPIDAMIPITTAKGHILKSGTAGSFIFSPHYYGPWHLAKLHYKQNNLICFAMDPSNRSGILSFHLCIGFFIVVSSLHLFCVCYSQRDYSHYPAECSNTCYTSLATYICLKCNCLPLLLIFSLLLQLHESCNIDFPGIFMLITENSCTQSYKHLMNSYFENYKQSAKFN